MRRSPHAIPRARGFTLVELLVAIMILAIVAVLGWRGLDGIVRARQTLTAQMETTRGMQLAFAQLQSDFEHRANPSLVHSRPFLQTSDAGLTLVRSVFTEDQPLRLQVVAYRLREGVLTRRESNATRDLVELDVLWQAAISDTDTTPAVRLQTGLTDMQVRLWDGSTWQVRNTPISQGASPLVPQAPVNTLVISGVEVSLHAQAVAAAMVKVFLMGGV